MNYCKEIHIYQYSTILFIISIHLWIIPIFKLSSALTIVAIERDLCHPNQASLDHISCSLGVISPLHAHMKSRLATECVNATSVYSRMKVDANVWGSLTGFRALSRKCPTASLFSQERWWWWSTFWFVWTVPFFLIFWRCFSHFYAVFIFTRSSVGSLSLFPVSSYLPHYYVACCHLHNVEVSS